MRLLALLSFVAFAAAASSSLVVFGSYTQGNGANFQLTCNVSGAPACTTLQSCLVTNLSEIFCGNASSSLYVSAYGNTLNVSGHSWQYNLQCPGSLALPWSVFNDFANGVESSDGCSELLSAASFMCSFFQPLCPSATKNAAGISVPRN